MKNKKQLVFHSITEGMYATIPFWALWAKQFETAKCYHSNRRSSIIVPLDELRELVKNHKIWVAISEETGDRYITSKEWRKYFN